MKRGLQDLAKSHELLHAKCGSAEGCKCAYCATGACKEDKPYATYSSFEDLVLCPRPEGEDSHAYACCMSLCGDCGVHAYREVTLPRTEATKLVFEPGTFVLTGVGGPPALLAKVTASLAARGIGLGAGCVPMCVNDVRVESASAYLEEVKPRDGDAPEEVNTTVRFAVSLRALPVFQ